jgi:hypothetical protein
VRAILSRDGGVLVARTAADRLEPYAPRGFADRLAEPGPAIRFLAGAPPLDGERRAATTTEDQLDDLRDLGYID